MKLERFDTYELPKSDVRDSLGDGTSRGDFFTLPSGGFDFYGSAEAPDRPTTIRSTRTIYAATPSALATELDTINGLRGKRKKLYARTYNDTIRWKWARLVGVTVARTNRNFKHQPVTFTWRAADAYWNGNDHSSWTLDAGYYLDSGLYLDQSGYTETMSSSPWDIAVSNDGNGDIYDAVITITAGGADITALTINRTNTDSTVETDLDYGATLTAGDDLVIDCGAFSVLNNGADDYANLTVAGNHIIDEWLRLEPGSNDIDITFTGGSTDSTVTVEFMDKWK